MADGDEAAVATSGRPEPSRLQQFDPGDKAHDTTISLSMELALRNSFLAHTNRGHGNCLVEAMYLVALHQDILPPFSDPWEARRLLMDWYLKHCLANGVDEEDVAWTCEYMRDLWKARDPAGRDLMLQDAKHHGCPQEQPLWDSTTGAVNHAAVSACIQGIGGSPTECAEAKGLITYVYCVLLANSSLCLGEKLMPSLGCVMGVRIAVVKMTRMDADDPSSDSLLASGPYGPAEGPLLVIAHICFNSRSENYNHYAAILQENADIAREQTSGQHLPDVDPRVVPWLDLGMWHGPEPQESLLAQRSAPASTGDAPHGGGTDQRGSTPPTPSGGDKKRPGADPGRGAKSGEVATPLTPHLQP
ncbi:hypothetical protein T484DRAFT_3637040, partial [Baffinella frigidus]